MRPGRHADRARHCCGRKAWVGFALSAVLMSGCDGEVASPSPEPESTPEAAPAAAEAVPLPSASAKRAEAPPKVEFQDTDFSESDRSRDPFRSFAKFFVDAAESGARSQREVVLDQYSLDELKLVGIVSRIHPARAMLVDPTGKGHVVTRGQFVGRAEIVQGSTNAAEYEINWRIERIRESDIVLVREDPANPDVPSATRVLVLRPEESVATR